MLEKVVLKENHPNYFEAVFRVESYLAFIKTQHTKSATPYFETGARNYPVIQMRNAYTYLVGFPNTYENFLHTISTNPGKLYGVYIVGDQYILTPPLLDPYYLAEKNIDGVTPTVPIEGDLPRYQDMGPTPDTQKLIVNGIVDVQDATELSKPCYVFPPTKLEDENNFVLYAMKRIIQNDVSVTENLH